MELSFILIIAVAVALFMGLNIGGNNAAASMRAAYGAKVRTKYQAVLLIGVFSVLGAVIDGGVSRPLEVGFSRQELLHSD